MDKESEEKRPLRFICEKCGGDCRIDSYRLGNGKIVSRRRVCNGCGERPFPKGTE